MNTSREIAGIQPLSRPGQLLVPVCIQGYLNITKNTVAYNAVFCPESGAVHEPCHDHQQAAAEAYRQNSANHADHAHFLSIVAIAMTVYAFLRPENGFINSYFGLGRFNWYGYDGKPY